VPSRPRKGPHLICRVSLEPQRRHAVSAFLFRVSIVELVVLELAAFLLQNSFVAGLGWVWQLPFTGGRGLMVPGHCILPPFLFLQRLRHTAQEPSEAEAT